MLTQMSIPWMRWFYVLGLRFHVFDLAARHVSRVPRSQWSSVGPFLERCPNPKDGALVSRPDTGLGRLTRGALPECSPGVVGRREPGEDNIPGPSFGVSCLEVPP